MSTTTRLSLIATVMLAAACTVKDTTAPPLAGPSELALRLGLQVTPDSIYRDGTSQAVLSIDASNGEGRAARGLGLRVEILVDGVIADFGTLSTKSVVTGEDGRARVTYTAPPRPAEPVDQNQVVQLRVTPIGNDFGGEVPRFVLLRLVTPGVILPPNTAPTPNFTADGSLEPFRDIVFDASQTTDPDLVSASNPTGACGANCNYAWEFGDGTTGAGVFVRHQYRAPGTFQVRLTATDGRGAAATLARPMQIGAATPPTAVFTYSPQPVETGQVVFFNAQQSTAAPGRRIVAYNWDFGSGRTASGITTTKSFDNPGLYTVTLEVFDDADARATFAQQVQVGAVSIGPGGPVTASLSVTPTTSQAAPAPLATVFLFDASASNGPAPIVEYRFNPGDGTADAVQTALPTWSYQYRTAGIYNVRVTVRDAQGRTDTTTRVVHVQ